MRLAVRQPWFNDWATFLIADHKPYYYVRVLLAHYIKRLRIYLYRSDGQAFFAEIDRIRATYPNYFTDPIHKIFLMTLVRTGLPAWLSGLNFGF